MRWPITAWQFVLLTGWVCAGAVDAQETPESKLRTEARKVNDQLVEQLGSDSFDERQQAARALLDAGIAALPSIERGLVHPDLEVQARCETLLEYLYEIDHQRVLAAFIRDPTTPPGNGLTGWKRFRELVGDTAAARELFAEMHQTEGRMFRLWALDPGEFGIPLERRCLELQHAYRSSGRREASIGSVSALLFLAGDARVPVSDAATSVLNSLLYYNNLRTSLTQGDRRQELQTLLSDWIARPAGPGNYQKLLLAMRYDMREGLIPAMALVRRQGTGLQLQYAILAIGKLGGAEHVRVVAELFENETLLSQSTRRGDVVYRCEVRDVALAVAIHLSGEEPSEYGFSRLRRNSTYLFSPNSAGFSSKEDRRAAFDRWSRSRPPQAKDAGGSKPGAPPQDPARRGAQPEGKPEPAPGTPPSGAPSGTGI